MATISNWAEKGVSNSTCRPRKLGLPVLGKRECLEADNAQYFSSDKSCVGVIGSISPICQVDAGAPVMFRSRSGVYELIGKLPIGKKIMRSLFLDIT